ncbi:unnamed protein product [Tenebrio molitor]|nr:unnamed protein product [Tenebrio molitor]
MPNYCSTIITHIPIKLNYHLFSINFINSVLIMFTIKEKVGNINGKWGKTVNRKAHM